MKCLVGVFLALLMFYAVFSWKSTYSETCFFLASPWVGMKAMLFFVFVDTVCMWHKHLCPHTRWMPEEDAGCPVSIILHFIPLRQGLLLNPGARLEASKLYQYSCLQPPQCQSYRCVCGFLHGCWRFQLGFSCLRSKWSRSLAILPALALHCRGAPCLVSALFGLSWAVFHSGDYRAQIRAPLHALRWLSP